MSQESADGNKHWYVSSQAENTESFICIQAGNSLGMAEVVKGEGIWDLELLLELLSLYCCWCL